MSFSRFTKSDIGFLRLLLLLEGLSFLFLLFIAMPLKYMADQPIYVRITGMVHGVLFVAAVAGILQLAYKYKWSFGGITFKLLLATFIPFGTFIADKKILQKMD